MPPDQNKRLIVALDVDTVSAALDLKYQVLPHAGLVKVGLRLFCAVGPAGVRSLNAPLMLDLKFHDLPTVVADAVTAVLPLKPNLLTVHGLGGAAMVAAARRAAEAAGADRPGILAVTLLTSLDPGHVPDQIMELARASLGCGADGLVCSPSVVGQFREKLGDDVLLVCPGIRLPDQASDDHAYPASPEAALESGADMIVVGRPITQAANPGVAAAAFARAMNQGGAT